MTSSMHPDHDHHEVRSIPVPAHTLFMLAAAFLAVTVHAERSQHQPSMKGLQNRTMNS